MRGEPSYQLELFPTADALNEAVAEFIIDVAYKASQQEGNSTFACQVEKRPKNYLLF